MVTFSQSQFDRFRKLVHALTGVTIAESRRTMLASRLRKRLRALEIDDLDTYYQRVVEDTTERKHFIDRVTTHETRFFRTARVWDYLQQHFLPEWSDEHPGRECRVWSAAASTGEEAYSVAMLMREYQMTKPSFQFSIHGTDVSPGSIEKCRDGLYSGRSIDRLRESHPEFLKRYFVHANDNFEISSALKNFVTFDTHNLFDKADHLIPFDLIFCRNVLIYFNADDQKRVLTNLGAALADNGKLIIGESEHLSAGHALFAPVHPMVYQPERPTKTPQPVADSRALEPTA